MRAPWETYSSSVIDDPSPAPFWTRTSWPRRTSSWTPTGVMPTRNSLFLTSLGMPTFTVIRPCLVSRTTGVVARGAASRMERGGSLVATRASPDPREIP